MITHAVFGASGAHRWMNCPGSVALCQGIPATAPSVYAREGTAAHTLIEKCVDGWASPSSFRGTKIDGFPVDDDMVAAVTVFTDRCFSAATNITNMWGSEQRVTLDRIWGTIPPTAMYGTVDFWELIDTTLVVRDYKHGKGVLVSAVNNPQLRYYALGLLFELEMLWPIDEVVMEIVQPRANWTNPVSSESMGAKALKEWGSRELKPAVEKALAPKAKLKTGPWCRFCPASATCPEKFTEIFDKTAGTFFPPVATHPPSPPSPSSLGTKELLLALDLIARVKVWAPHVLEIAQHKLELGESLPGWKLVAKQGRRRWGDPDAIVNDLAGVLAGLPGAPSRDKLEIITPISPAELDKLLAQCHIEIADELSNLTQVISSGNKVVREEVDQPAVISQSPFAKHENVIGKTNEQKSRPPDFDTVRDTELPASLQPETPG